MWQHFDNFELGSNFNAWAHRFVFNRVLAYRKTKKRENDRFILSDDFYEMISDHAENKAEETEEKMACLNQCMEKLPQEQRTMLRMRYFEEASIEKIAEKINKSVDATYRSLSRIRVSLRECVHKTWTVEST